MFRSSDFTKPSYKTGEVAKILGLTIKTIQNYDKQGRLVVNRTATNQRAVFRADLLDFIDSLNMLMRDDEKGKADVIYARVSSNEQKQKGDLDRQVVYLVENAPRLQNPVILKEVGSGLNDKRVQLHKLLQMVMADEVKNIYVTYKDRLTRFGYYYIEAVCKQHGASITAIKGHKAEKSVEQELTSDLMDLIASFSGKIYGLRSNKNKKPKGAS